MSNETQSPHDRRQAYVWGQIYGLIDRVANLTPAQLERAAAYPLSQFGALLSRHNAKLANTPEDALIAKWVEEITDEPEHFSEVLQGDWWLGYYHSRKGQDRDAKLGPPLAENRVDWAKVDWSKGDATLSRELGVSRQAVRSARIRHGKKVDAV